MLHRREGESQEQTVRRLLREHGSVSAQECLFNMSWARTGAATCITRLGARIWELRHGDEPLRIQTVMEGRFAVYVLDPRDRMAA
jgi:hypothetical protein